MKTGKLAIATPAQTNGHGLDRHTLSAFQDLHEMLARKTVEALLQPGVVGQVNLQLKFVENVLSLAKIEAIGGASAQSGGSGSAQALGQWVDVCAQSLLKHADGWCLQMAARSNGVTSEALGRALGLDELRQQLITMTSTVNAATTKVTSQGPQLAEARALNQIHSVWTRLGQLMVSLHGAQNDRAQYRNLFDRATSFATSNVVSKPVEVVPAASDLTHQGEGSAAMYHTSEGNGSLGLSEENLVRTADSVESDQVISRNATSVGLVGEIQTNLVGIAEVSAHPIQTQSVIHSIRIANIVGTDTKSINLAGGTVGIANRFRVTTEVDIEVLSLFEVLAEQMSKALVEKIGLEVAR